MKVQIFDGGQASRLRPQFIQQNQAVIYKNIDNSVGSLAPVKDKIATEITVPRYHEYYIAGKEWIGADVPTDFLEFQKIMYLTNGIDRPQKYSNGNYFNLGISRPGNTPSAVRQDQAKPLIDFTVLNEITNATGDLPISDLRYALFNVTNGVFSSPYYFTVTASTTNVIRASGKVTTYDDIENFDSGNADTIQGVNREIVFKDLRGTLGDEAQLYRNYNGKWYQVGVFASVSDILVDNTEDISGNTLLNETVISPFNGTYQYVYTHYNSNDGTESAPSNVSSELEVDSGLINVSGLVASSDPQVDKKRLYRVGGNVTEFTLVVELDNATTSYLDELNDTELDGRLLASDNYFPAPTGLRFLTESYAMLFGAVDTTLRFTPIGVPNAWPPEFSIQFDSPITGIGPIANGVLVMTEFRTFIVTGTGPFSLTQQLLSGDQGCIAFESIQEIGEALIWASAEGLCMSNGNSVTNITKDPLGEIRLTPIDSEVTDEVYYCLNEDGTILSWDFRFGSIPKFLDLGVVTIAYANNTLYGWSGNVLYELFKSEGTLPFTYLSPRFIEGASTERKTYKKVHIYSKGDIIINILINDEVVVTKSLSGEDSFQLQIPQDKQRGNFIQFQIEGTGEVYEYEYIAGRRQND